MTLHSILTSWFSSGVLGVFSAYAVYCVYTEVKYRYRLNKGLRGVVVLITGASSGIGEACAKLFHKHGARLILSARRIDQLERVKNEIVQSNATDNKRFFEPVVVVFDATCFDETAAFAAKVNGVHEGRGLGVDVVISNAGVSFRGDIESSTMAAQRKVFEVNYFGQVALVKDMLPYMLAKNSGHFVTIGSIQSKLALGYRSAYSASKHASSSFFDSLRSETSDKGIKVTSINPGYVNTPLSLSAVKSNGQRNNKMSEDTAKGMSPEYLACRVLRAVLLQEQEVNIAPMTHHLAVTFRNALPRLVLHMLHKKALKERKNM